MCRRDGLNIDMDIDKGMVQRWTGRYDCIPHSHILLYVTAKLRKRGILTSSEGYKGRVMIDDALFCFSKKSTQEQKEMKCLCIEAPITDAKTDLGLMISKDKTIISTLNFTFLNRFFSQGAEVVKPLRTMMKICTSSDQMMVKFQSQIQDITGSIRGAIKKGADPMLVYVMALRLAVNTALCWDLNIAKRNIISLITQIISPSYLSGCGFPAFVDLFTKEKTDLMRPTNIYAQALAEIKEGSKSYEKCKSVLGAIYHPNVYSFTSYPLIPAYKGVDNPTSRIRLTLRNMVKCGEFFEGAAEVDSNNEVSEVIWEIVRSCTWDPAILESLRTMRPFASSWSLNLAGSY